ncbi:MAG: hypothetical protein ABI433_01880, partial [Burkholderiaceae bacterium]
MKAQALRWSTWVAARRDSAAMAEPLWLEWLALGGVLTFATWLLGVRGVWALLLGADPTGITLVIIVIFAAATLWCGARARVLQCQRAALSASGRRDRSGRSGCSGCSGCSHGNDDWSADYLEALRGSGADGATALDLLL